MAFSAFVCSLGQGISASYVIDATKSQTVGSTAAIPGSGTAANTNFWTAGTVVGAFILRDGAGNHYGMQVTASNPTENLKSGTDSLMVVRTENSQGLTDTGTLSVYVRPTGTNTADGAATVSGAWSLDLNFSFYEVTGDLLSGFTITATPAVVGLQLTSLDIDYGQKYFTQNSSFTGGNSTYSPTNITGTAAPTGYTGFRASGDSSFSNPAHAVSSKGTGSSFNVQVAHESVALYMFEFRDPSMIVPEPGTGSMLALGLISLLLFGRRMQTV